MAVVRLAVLKWSISKTLHLLFSRIHSSATPLASREGGAEDLDRATWSDVGRSTGLGARRASRGEGCGHARTFLFRLWQARAGAGRARPTTRRQAVCPSLA